MFKKYPVIVCLLGLTFLALACSREQLPVEEPPVDELPIGSEVLCEDMPANLRTQCHEGELSLQELLVEVTKVEADVAEAEANRDAAEADRDFYKGRLESRESEIVRLEEKLEQVEKDKSEKIQATEDDAAEKIREAESRLADAEAALERAQAEAEEALDQAQAEADKAALTPSLTLAQVVSYMAEADNDVTDAVMKSSANIREHVAELIDLETKSQKEVIARLTSQLEIIDQQQKAVDERQEKLDESWADLNTQKAALTERETDISRREANIEVEISAAVKAAIPEALEAARGAELSANQATAAANAREAQAGRTIAEYQGKLRTINDKAVACGSALESVHALLQDIQLDLHDQIAAGRDADWRAAQEFVARASKVVSDFSGRCHP